MQGESRWIVEAARGSSGAVIDEQALELARRRVLGEPLQYVTGVAGFRTIELSVGPGVFIPRPETELVTEIALSLLPTAGTLVDIGTGSGAIALATKAERPDARVLATELSREALAWATKNRDALGSDVMFLAGDLFDPLPDDLVGEVDVVASNPPYIAGSDPEQLPVDVVAHEPWAALFAGVYGMDVVERLATGAHRWLRSGGYLVTEIGATQGADAIAVLEEAGYQDVEVRTDLVGRDRIAIGRRA